MHKGAMRARRLGISAGARVTRPRMRGNTVQLSLVGERHPELSLVVPAYNEGHRIEASLRSMSCYLDNMRLDYEIVVVSDGSTDDTAEVVRSLARDDPRIHLIDYPDNRGKGFAVRCGVLNTRGEYIVFTDADLSIPIEIVNEFLPALRDGFDIAIASRGHPESIPVTPPSAQRQIMGKVFRWCVKHVLVSGLSDTQCGGKAYRREIARSLFNRQRIDHFSFDAEVLFLAVRNGYRIKEVPVALNSVPTSSIRPMRDSLCMLRDLFRIRLYARLGFYD